MIPRMGTSEGVTARDFRSATPRWASIAQTGAKNRVWHLAIVLAVGAVIPSVAYSDAPLDRAFEGYFASSAVALPLTEKQRLLDQLGRIPHVLCQLETILVVAHASPLEGGRARTNALSIERMEYVMQLLVHTGVPSQIINGFGKGTDQPIANRGEIRNARVEIEFIGNFRYSRFSKSDECPQWSY